MARTWYKSQAEARATKAADGYSDLTSITFTPEAETDYYVLWSSLVDASSNSSDVLAKLVDDTNGVDLAEINVEPHDNTDVICVGGVRKWSAGPSPSSTTLSIEYAREAATTVGAYSTLAVLKAGPADGFAESLSTSTTSSSTLQDKTVLTFTPAAAGDYLIVASAEYGNTTNNNSRLLLDINGTAHFDGNAVYMSDASNFLPWTRWCG